MNTNIDQELSTSMSETETFLRKVLDMVAAAKALPLSASVKLDNRDELTELLQHAIDRFPEELREARWMCREREEYLAKTRREGDEILDAARQRAARLVARTEVVRAAEHRARQMLERAAEDARRMRHEAEDYCDQRLANFEIVLERTLKTISAGRQKLNVTGLGYRDEPDQAEDTAPAPSEGGLFDQDKG